MRSSCLHVADLTPPSVEDSLDQGYITRASKRTSWQDEKQLLRIATAISSIDCMLVVSELGQVLEAPCEHRDWKAGYLVHLIVQCNGAALTRTHVPFDCHRCHRVRCRSV